MDAVKVKEELKKGLEAVNQLRVLLSSESSSSEEQVLRACKHHHSAIILKSFDNALSILRHAHFTNPSTQLFYNAPRSIPPMTVTTDLKEDGFTWRKYGQKSIVNAKHPREYYRCGLRDHGCKATKKVQVITENPTTYKVIYYGKHSCQNYQPIGDEFRQVITSIQRDSANMLSFSCSNYESNPEFKLARSDDDHPKLSPLTNFTGQQDIIKLEEETNNPCKSQENQYAESSLDRTALQETPGLVDADESSPMRINPNMNSPHFTAGDCHYLGTGCDMTDDWFLGIDNLWDD